MKNFYLKYIGFILALTGCTSSTQFALNPTTSATATPTPASSSTVKAVKIIFSQSSSGSFNSPSSTGTTPSPGSGLQATRLFYPNGTVLASAGAGGANWPAWLSSFEMGISGPSNTSSLNPNCANFAGTTESSTNNCQIGGVASNCGAAAGLFRVSEVDCSVAGSYTTASVGVGGPSDGIYFRAQFNRNTAYLGATENILVTLEYAVAGLNPAPADPTTCFSGGQFSPELCTDFVWRAYLKHTTSEIVQPYLLLVPPIFSSLLPNNSSSGFSSEGVAAKQFYLPLASDPTLTVLQISRTQSNFPSTTTLKNYCTVDGSTLPANSALCAGIVFYSMTFYRM